MNIVEKHLDSNQYYQEETKKSQIVLHHTVSSTFESTFNWWQQTSSHVGTAYVIDKDGTIYETFSPKYWAYHLGLGVSSHEKKAIGIELVNESYLTKRDNGKMYWLDNKARYFGKWIEKKWRGHKYWSVYPTEQIDALADLLKKLVDDFNINKKIITHYNPDLDLIHTKGIISHCNVRQDKTDVSPALDLEFIELLIFPELSSLNLNDYKPMKIYE